MLRTRRRAVFESLEGRVVMDGSLVISELMASNSGGLADSDGTFSDWIEIHNTSAAPVSLAGWHLTDDASLPDKWTFPDQQLAGGGYLVVFASGKNRAVAGSELHTNFSLSQDGEYLALSQPNDTIASVFNPFPKQKTDISYGLEQGQITTTLLAAGAPARALVPTSNSLEATWNQSGFNDSAWLGGTTGVGYDRTGVLQSAIGLDLLSPAIPAASRIDTNGDGTNENNSVYTRTTFNVADPGSFNSLALDVQYDDGFVAYLNGQEVARANAPAATAWNSTATADRPGAQVMMAITYDASNNITIYRNGQLYTAAANSTLGNLQTYPGGVSDVLVGLRHEDISGGAGSAGGVDQFLAGFVDEARIYNTALTPQQLQAIYTSGPVIGAGSTNDPALLHQWTFNSGTTDVRGGTTGTLFGGATVSGGRLALDGINDYMRSAPLPATITTKTLVSWVSLANLSQQAGSALTIENPTGADVFDAIVYAERIPNQWMAGSNGFTRSVTNNNGGAESVIEGQAPTFQTFDIAGHLNKLVPNQNVLAIQALNSSLTSPDMVVLPKLVAKSEPLTGPLRFFPAASPGVANHDGVEGFVSDTTFDHHRGFYSAAFDVAIATVTPNSTIRYTTDGSAPTETHGTVYTAPVHVTTTTTLRAAAFRTGYAPTNVDTETFIFAADVLHQPNVAPGGAHWDTEMDPEVVNNTTQTFSVAQALVALPTVSLVMDNADLFGAEGIYSNPTARGDFWQRVGSVEYFYPDQYTGYRVGDGFSLDAGVSITGDAGRNTFNPKHSLRLAFKSEFGPSKLEYPLFEDHAVTTFDTLMLRTGHNQGWATGTPSSEYIRDQFARDVQLAMGQESADGRKVHVYLNGLYWGIYDLTEKPDSSFSAEHFGGNKDDYDELTGATGVPATQADLAQGTRAAWEAMFAIAASDMTLPANYAAIQQYLDIDNLIDYTISNAVTGELDAPTCICEVNSPRNFFATRLRDPEGQFRFFRWDAEFTLQDPSVDNSERAGFENPGLLHNRLRNNAEYRLRFADHVQKMMFDGGPLTAANLKQLYLQRVAEIDQAVVGESARWGDSKTSAPFTRDVHWVAERNRIANTYFTQRNPIVINQFTQDGLFPAVAAPAYTVNGQPKHGGQVISTDQIGITGSGDIYYTLDGSDPRVPTTPQVVTTLIAEGAATRALVPVDASLQANWKDRLFNDSSWLSGNAGVGFDRSGSFAGLIALDLLSPTIPAASRIDTNGDGTNENNSVYTRTTFNVNNPTDFASLTLNARYDDGFVAYLNGQEVAKANAPAAIDWNSTATADRASGVVMMAITYGSNNQITIYRNGQVYATAAATSLGGLQSYPGGIADVLIGARHEDAAGGAGTETGADPFLAGFVDEARVYKTALTAQEIQTIFNVGPITGNGATSDPNLAHQWTFNAGTQDVVGGANGTLLNGATVSGGRLGLDGVNDYMRSTPLPATITTKTLISWVSLKNLGQQAGSALTIENPTGGDVFDAIVYAERVSGQWMAGSNGFTRSVGNNGGAAETLIDVPVTQFATFDISAHLNKLVQGQNVLAIQALNSGLTNGDMLISPKLTASAAPPSNISPTAIHYTAPFSISTTSTVNARRLVGGVWSPLETAEFLLNVPAAAGNLAISEINYDPADPTDAELAIDATFDHDSFEFVEVQNIGNQSIDLAGVQLSQGVGFNFDNGGVKTLGPGQRAVVVRSVEGFQARYGTSITIAGVFSGKLADGGEDLILLDKLDGVIENVTFDDEGDWPERPDGKGSSLEAVATTGDVNDPAHWRASTEYNGSPGAAGVGPIHDVVINEVLTHTVAPAVDAIELHNTTAAAIDIGGWYLSDASSQYLKYQIPAGTILPAGGYLIFDEEDFNPTPATPAPNHFSLNGAHGDRAVLVTAAAGLPLRFMDDVQFDAAAAGESFGRWPNAIGDLYPMKSLTLGAANSGPRIGDVLISEVRYNVSPNLQFIELFNDTGATQDIGGWKFDKGIDFTFAPGTTLAPYGSLVVVPFNPQAEPGLAGAFLANYGASPSVKLAGPFVGTLSPTGERVRLARPDAPPLDEPLFTPYFLADQVNYDDVAPWPSLPPGPLALTRDSLNIYGDDPANWRAASASPGTVVNRVTARHTFYNNSAFDGNDSAPGAADDLAIATDKAALLPAAGKASFTNYTNYTSGINGVMIDISARGAMPVAGDFTFRVGNSSNVDTWTAAPAPASISIRSGAGVGGSDRITITWGDGAIQKTWLEVRFVAPAMGMATPDVFYFGNAVGETGNSPADAMVNAADEVAARNNPRTFMSPAGINDHYDFNRDGFVNAADQILARSNAAIVDALVLIQPSSGGGISLAGPDFHALSIAVALSQREESFAATLAAAQPLEIAAVDSAAGIEPVVLRAGPGQPSRRPEFPSRSISDDTLDVTLDDELVDLLADV